MRTHFPRWLLLLAGGAILYSTWLVAFSGNSLAQGTRKHAATGTVTLRWLEWWRNEWGPSVLQKLITGFEKKNPNIKISVVDVPWPNMQGKLSTAAAVGGSHSYDVVGMENQWMSGMDKQGFLENLGPKLKKDPSFAKTLTPQTPMQYFGQTKGLCLYLIPYSVAYNVDMFRAKHLGAPKSWSAYTRDMRILRNPKAGVYGTMLPLADPTVVMTRLFAFRLAQLGGQMLDKKGNVAFNSAAGVAALKWWKNFYQAGLAAPGALGQDQTTKLDMFAGKRVASVIDGPFIWTNVHQKNSKIRLAFAPPWKDKTGGYSWACSGLAVNSKSPNQAQAWQFLKYIYSAPVSRMMTKQVRLPWATKAGIASLKGSKDPILRYIPRFASQDPKHNVYYPVLPNQITLETAFQQSFNEALSGKMTPKAALRAAAQVWQAEINKNRK